PALEVLADRHRLQTGVFERGSALAVEAQDIEQHAMMRRAKKVSRVREEAAKPRSAVLHVATAARGAERHFARLRRDAELGEELREIRIGALVVDDEAGVELERLPVIEHGDRVRVS